MNLCKNCPTNLKKKYKGNEPSPKGLGYCAGCMKKIGIIKRGKDGNNWITDKRKSGELYWKKYNQKINKKNTKIGINQLKTIVKLKPFLIYESNDFQNMYTRNKEIDKILENRLKNDYIKVAKDIFFQYKVIDYNYIRNDNIIKITISHEYPLNKKEIKEYIDEAGPDTWMEGNIIILDVDEARKTPYYKNKISVNPIELGLRVVDFE